MTVLVSEQIRLDFPTDWQGDRAARVESAGMWWIDWTRDFAFEEERFSVPEEQQRLEEVRQAVRRRRQLESRRALRDARTLFDQALQLAGESHAGCDAGQSLRIARTDDRRASGVANRSLDATRRLRECDTHAQQRGKRSKKTVANEGMQTAAMMTSARGSARCERAPLRAR